MGILDHLTCFLRNLYAGLEATVRTGCELVPNWERSMSGCILSLYLFNLYAEWIMWNARLDDSQAGIKIPRRIINNLRYANDTTLMAESKEEWKNLLMRVKEKSEREGLKLNIQKTKMVVSGPITSWQIEGGKMETVTDFLFLGSKITADSDCSHEIKRCVLLGRKPRQHIQKQRNYFASKGPSGQSYGFSSSHVWCESWT